MTDPLAPLSSQPDDLAGPSVQETEPETLEGGPSIFCSVDEPWRVFPDSDIEIPGDRLDKRGNPTEGIGAFRVHSLDTAMEMTEKGEENVSHCYNDFTWGACYRNVQSILSQLRHTEIEIWKHSGHHKKGEEPTLRIAVIPTLPELTLAMGGGNAWVPREEEEEEPPLDAKAAAAAARAAKAKKEDEPEPGPKEKFEECAVVEPHDIRDYLNEHYAEVTGPMRLITWQTRECARLFSNRTSLLGKESTYEVWQRPPGTYDIGSPECIAQCMRLRALIATHLFEAAKPILIDDSVNSYLIVGYREFDPFGPNEEAPVQYRIIDAQYGLRYAIRRYDFIFDPEKGHDQLGTDVAKDQWVPAEWVEEGRDILNKYVPGPTWMALFIGDLATSPSTIISHNTADARAHEEAEELARHEAQAAFLAEEMRLAEVAMAAAGQAQEGDEDEPEGMTA